MRRSARYRHQIRVVVAVAVALSLSVGTAVSGAATANAEAAAPGAPAVTAAAAAPTPPPLPADAAAAAGSVTRSEFVDDVVNADGTHTAVLSLEPLNMSDGAAGFVPIDTTVSAALSGDLGSLRHPLKPTFARDAASGSTVTLTPSSGRLSFGLIGSRPARATKRGLDGVRYTNMLDGVDADYTVSRSAVKEVLVVRKRVAPTARPRGRANAAASAVFWQFAYKAPGLRAVQTGDGGIAFNNYQGVPVAVVPPGRAWDSAARRSEIPVSYTLGSRGRDLVITVSVDRAWASAARRVYPLHIDPTFSTPQASSQSFLKSGTGCAGCRIRVGNDVTPPTGWPWQPLDAIWQTSAHFPYEELLGAKIGSVSLHLTLNLTGSATASEQPLYVSPTRTLAFDGEDSPNLATALVGTDATLTDGAIADQIRTWVTTRTQGKSLFFRGREAPGVRSYKDFTATMNITYTPSDAVPILVSPADGAVAVSTTPTLQIAFPNPTKRQRFYFGVYDTSQIYWNSGWTTGMAVTVGVPLPKKSGLHWRVFVLDGFPNSPPRPAPEWTFSTVLDTNTSVFVYVALGDSYSSGEGAGNSIPDAQRYQTAAYEIGPQQDGTASTYTRELDHGDGCHRALQNYAKLNRDRLQPTAQTIVLIDVTCSGAVIAPDGGIKLPVVGNYLKGTYEPDPASQVTEAIRQLSLKGLSPADVDLVTVGMGGNDASFGEFVAACMVPNMLRSAVATYPNPPLEVKALVERFATCGRVDGYLFHTERTLATLYQKEIWAQATILNAFQSAHVLQLDYPDILPSRNDSPVSNCQGINKVDLNYAKGRIAKIDQIIANAATFTAQSNHRLQLVEMKDTFGRNALCGIDPASHLANGISRASWDAEVRRLLNLDGNGDPESRRLLDLLVDDYGQLKVCLILNENLPPFAKPCDAAAALDKVKADLDAILAYLLGQQTVILANAIAPPTSVEPEKLRFDRSRGLFHPNANGYAVQACNVRAKYFATAPTNCVGEKSPVVDTVRGHAVQNAPLPVGDGLPPVHLGGYAAGSTVRIVMNSTPIDLGSVIADANGVIDASVQLPDVRRAGAGAHTVTFQGVALEGIGIGKEVRVVYPGRPVGGQSYAAYLCCFDLPVFHDGPITGVADPSAGGTPIPGDTSPGGADESLEKIDVLYHGLVFYTMTPDEDGGVYVELPVLDLPNSSAPVVITARSQRTGKEVSTTIYPIPSVTGLWASSQRPGALVVNGSTTTVTGLVHSDSDVTVTGSGTTFSTGTEYATELTVRGSGHALANPRQTAPGGLPSTVDIADYRPGGTRALAAGASYHAIAASDCAGGLWTADAASVPSGVIYVPCAAHITGSTATVDAVIAAEGAVQVSGSAITLGRSRRGEPGVVSGATGDGAVRITGSAITVRGTIEALAGSVEIHGSGTVIRCGVIADTIRVAGSHTSVVTDRACLNTE